MKMMKMLISGLLVLGPLGIGSAACGSDKPAEATPSTQLEPTPAVVSAKAGPVTPAKTNATLAAHYDALRAALANDDLPATRSASALLAQTAAKIPMLGPSATTVSAAKDLGSARLAFGDVSKAYITYLVANPKDAEGAHVFRCPMADGYKKWVQREAKMANPYMGQRMLQCGSKVALAP